MVFSAGGVLSDENGILSAAHDIMTLKDLERRFIRALYDDADDFFALCASQDRDGLRIYKIREISKVEKYRFAFCEKAAVLGENLTFVYLARDISSFHSLMSPSAGLLRSPADTTVYELLALRRSAIDPSVNISTEAFAVLERFPALCKAIFDTRVSAQYCDVTEITEHIISKIANGPSFVSKISLDVRHGVSSNRNDGEEESELIELPVEAYTAVLAIATSVAAALSSDHKLGATVSFYSYAADVEIVTRTSKIEDDVKYASLGYLSKFIPSSDIARIAEAIAFISGIDLYVSRDSASGCLKIVIGLGYELQSPPDFKFSDPIACADRVYDEVSPLIAPSPGEQGEG